MKREAMEEAAIEYETDWQPTVLLVGDDFTCHFFAARLPVRVVPQTMTDESIECCPYPHILTHDDIIPNLRYIIPLSANEHILPVATRYPIRIEERKPLTQASAYVSRR